MHGRLMSYVVLLGAFVASVAPAQGAVVFNATFNNSSSVPMRVSSTGGCSFALQGAAGHTTFHAKHCTGITSATITPVPRASDGEVRMRLAEPPAFTVPPGPASAFSTGAHTVTWHKFCGNQGTKMVFFVGTQRDKTKGAHYEKRITDAQGNPIGWELTISQVC